jgi:LPS-assembly protein
MPCQVRDRGFSGCGTQQIIRMAIKSILLTAARRVCLFLPLLVGCEAVAQEPNPGSERVRTEIPYREGKVTLVSDFQERVTRTRYRASGNVLITYQDIVITCDEAEYDEATRSGSARGTVRFSQGKQWFTGSRGEFDFASQTGTFYDATGFTDQEFLIKARTVVKTGPDTYKVLEGFVTACQERNPKWSFSISTAEVRVNRTTRLRNTLFKVKGVPILYVPYMILPMEEKKRSSGLLPPHYGNSSSKGRLFGMGYYQTLGRSADLTAYGDYFSKRGLALGGIFRARPRPDTRLYLEAYGINDRLGQGGANLVVDGESTLGSGLRAVASANITTNFSFRQAFSDSFRLATVPEERSIFFLTQNQESYSTNFALQRDEIRFPVRSVVIRKSPSIELASLGAPISGTPLIFELRASADGLSRADSVLETPRLVQRLDFFPRIALRLPAIAGFSLIPSAGVRDTYYSARVTEDNPPQIVPRSIHRQYFDLELNLRFPTLERTFAGSRLGTFEHVIEPFLTYRRIQGIDNMRQIIRFDEHDAVADTSEFEFGIVNRFFAARGRGARVQNEEFLSLAVIQKYYFDPTFGGALRPGEVNVFYPLDTVTGFGLTGGARRLPPTNFIMRITPKPAIAFEVRADFDTRYNRLRDATVSANWQHEKLLAAGTYIKTSALEPGTIDSHHIQGVIGYGSPTRGFSAGSSESYDIQNAKLLNTNTRVNYVWDCCGVSLQYQHFDLGLRTERRLTFSFSLKGIGSFGNIRRPESLF